MQNPYFKNLDVMKIADFISNIKINEKLFKKNFINFYKNK